MQDLAISPGFKKLGVLVGLNFDGGNKFDYRDKIKE